MSATQTYFDQVSKSYADVPFEQGVDVPSFIEATENLIKMFDVVGSAAFTPMKVEMQEGVDKLNEIYSSNPANNTLEKLVQSEANYYYGKEATESLLWLVRDLRFIFESLKQNQDKPNEEIAESFSEAYNRTLVKHHNMIIAQMFQIAITTFPVRADFYGKLGQDQARVSQEIKRLLLSFEKIILAIETFYTKGNYGSI
ncbi:hypothetical protein DSO57_1032404 [Entomophthora muscae]|uniref:Uncharacterized protein n=1 Tax=Entomophthora muscae TaxID=34485 RepID=A0ACC2TMR3_9FUNG|nr:hypothetical protein DSO57_1032404 [Entomophthora muscae]